MQTAGFNEDEIVKVLYSKFGFPAAMVEELGYCKRWWINEFKNGWNAC
jgi:hypothetical protein